MVQIHTPVGEVGTPAIRLAPSPSVLAGCRIGILDNQKPNADVLLRRLADRLAERTGAEVTRYETKNAAIPCEDQVLERLTKEVQIVLTGSAD